MKGGWPTFTFFVKVGTTSSPVAGFFSVGRLRRLSRVRRSQILGAPLFRVLCERVGAGTRMPWAAMLISIEE